MFEVIANILTLGYKNRSEIKKDIFELKEEIKTMKEKFETHKENGTKDINEMKISISNIDSKLDAVIIALGIKK